MKIYCYGSESMRKRRLKLGDEKSKGDGTGRKGGERGAVVAEMEP